MLCTTLKYQEDFKQPFLFYVYKLRLLLLKKKGYKEDFNKPYMIVTLCPVGASVTMIVTDAPTGQRVTMIRAWKGSNSQPSNP